MSDINQPCIRRCCLNEENICLGCFRTFDDMRQWNKASIEEKQEMLNMAERRKREHAKK
ncbi:DUF1289 domain-containing protein [Sulfurovum sp.]|uniref:DUF1289 domain-containing protein n=1 Tax=Sulfurovum sp. TaxID=1969726 RepID=UPI00286800AD|nr:DUF1289 domain-containing protein [Sulfurovum sp.]